MAGVNPRVRHFTFATRRLKADGCWAVQHSGRVCVGLTSGLKIVRSGFLLCLVLVSLLPCFAASPDVTLEGLDGNNHHLDEYVGRGQWVILNIWGPRCPPCLEEMPELISFHEDHRHRDAIVVGMALDFPSFGYAKKGEVARFVDENFVDFPVLLGEGEVVPRLGAGILRGVPTTLVFSPSGKLVAVHVGTVTQEALETFLNNYGGSD